jgi:hypothetical protein
MPDSSHFSFAYVFDYLSTDTILLQETGLIEHLIQ